MFAAEKLAQTQHVRSASESAVLRSDDRSSFELRPLGLRVGSPWPEVRLSPRHAATASILSAGSTPQPWPSADLDAASYSPAPSFSGLPSFAGRRLDFTAPISSPAVDQAAEARLPEHVASTASPASLQHPHKRRMEHAWLGRNGRLAFLLHFWGLGFSEFPMTQHRQWLGLTQRPPLSGSTAEGGAAGSTGPSKAGKLKRRLLLGMGSSHRRFVPLENLEEQYASNRKRRRLMYALRRHHTPGSYRSRLDAFCNEAFIACQLFFDRCTPRRLRAHPPWFTAAFLALSCVTFAFMAGEYPAYLTAHSGLAAARACPLSAFGNGPHGLAAWVYHWDHCHKFDSSFLVEWGASYAPKVNQAKQWWRWGSSLLLADSFAHAAANALLFAVLGLHLESRFSTRATAFVVVLSGLGGNFFDAAFRGICSVVISSTGCTFGLLSLFIADFALNFEAIRFPFLRVAVAICSLILFVLAMTIFGYPYRLTPVGGFLTGLFPSMLFLPHLKSEVIEWCIPLLALFTCVGFLIALPLYIYLVRFPDAQCM